MPVHKALIAVHFQNDICHPAGVVPFAVDRGSGDAQRFLEFGARTRSPGRAMRAG